MASAILRLQNTQFFFYGLPESVTAHCDDAAGVYLDTYYLNDVWGNPLVVLSPEAAARMNTKGHSWAVSSDPVVKDYAFVYQYDHHGRLLFKKLPGCEEVRYAYDRYGRQVLVQEDAYGYGGKEFTTTKGLNFYDFGVRTYVPDEGRFWQPDPKAGDYHWLSPYAYCAGDPINKIDPTGEQIFYVNMSGVLITAEETGLLPTELNEYEKDANNCDRIVIIDKSGNTVKVTASPMYDVGTIEGIIQNTAYKDSKKSAVVDFITFKVRGDDNGTEIFKFLANSITGSNGIEYSHLMLGEKGDKGLNMITTSHTEGKECGAGQLFVKQLQFGYTIREWNHSHPTTNGPSDGDIRIKDLVNANRYPKIVHKIYYVPTGKEIDYTNKKLK